MSADPICPKCQAANVYPDGNLWICPDCFHEWSQHDLDEASEVAPAGGTSQIKDAHGNVLAEGDSVTVVKELKIKGSSSVVKVGTKVKNIRLVDSNDGHNFACKIEGIGSINLKSEFVKKA